MGINATRNGNVYTYLTSGEAIQAGDIVTIGEDDGHAYWALNPTATYAGIRPLTSTGAALNVAQDLVTYGSAVSSWGQSDAVQLGNGNIAVFGNAASTNYPTLWIFDATGALVTAAITVEVGVGNSSNMAITLLSNGNIALAYSGAGNANPKRAVYAADGTLVSASSAIEAVTGVAGLCLTSLSGGGFVVGYYRTTASVRQPYFARFDNTGALQGSVVAVDTTSVTNKNRLGHSMAVCGLTGGNFAVAFYVAGVGAGNQQTAYVNIYNSSGVKQGSTKAIASSFSTTYGGATEHQFYLKALADGTFVWACWLLNNISHVRYQRMTAAGGISFSEQTFTTPSAALPNAPGANPVAVIDASTNDGAFIIAAYNGDGNTEIDYLASNASGANAGISWTTISTMGGNASWAYDSTTGEYILALSAGVSGTITYYRYAPTNLAAANSAASSASTGVSGLLTKAFATANPAQPLIRTIIVIGSSNISSASVSGFRAFTPRVQQMTLTGIAITAATAADQQFLVCIRGTAATRLGFKYPYAVDARSNSRPGQRMSVVGNTATLHGVLSGDVLTTTIVGGGGGPI